MNISFELRKEKINKAGLVPIQLVVRHDGNRIRKNTGVSVFEHHWNGHRVTKQLGKENENNYEIKNSDLQKIETKVSKLFLYLSANEIPFTIEKFNELFEKKEEIQGTEYSFFDCFEEYIEKGKLTKAPNTIKGQTTVLNYIKFFCEEKGIEPTFEKIDNSFYELLMEYTYQEKEKKQNYFAKIIKVLKSFLNWATDKGYNTKRAYEKFKAPEHDIDIIYLTPAELEKLKNMKFENPTYDKVRDIFCFGIYSSFRFSDLSRLHLANITEEHITISIQKTKTQNHTVKLTKGAKEILAKYKGTIYEPLPTISNQKFNEYIKICCELAEINDPFTIHWFVGTKKKSLTQPKWKFITAHSSRKTHITQSILRGMTLDAVKRNANITKEKTLEKYAKYTQAFLDEQMNKAWD